MLKIASPSAAAPRRQSSSGDGDARAPAGGAGAGGSVNPLGVSIAAHAHAPAMAGSGGGAGDYPDFPDPSDSPKTRPPRVPHGGVGSTLARFAQGDRGAASKALGILTYSACSSSMLVVNKIAVGHLPVPTALRCGAGSAHRVACGGERGRRRRPLRARGADARGAAARGATPPQQLPRPRPQRRACAPCARR
jgi:hypothetical protein